MVRPSCIKVFGLEKSLIRNAQTNAKNIMDCHLLFRIMKRSRKSYSGKATVMLMISGCWWLKVDNWMLVPEANIKWLWILVTKMAKTITTIFYLSPTYFATNISVALRKTSNSFASYYVDTHYIFQDSTWYSRMAFTIFHLRFISVI